MTDASCRLAVGKALLLLVVTATLWVEAAYATQRWGATVSTASASTGAMMWQSWSAPTEPLSGAEAELQSDLIRHVEMTVAVRHVMKTFPLRGDLLDGRTFWAAVVIPESDYTYYVAVVYERRGDGWYEVARHRDDSPYSAVPSLAVRTLIRRTPGSSSGARAGLVESRSG